MANDSQRPVALITGAARRIGAGITTALHDAGLDVLVHCRHSETDARALVAHLNCQRPDSAAALTADLAVADAVRALADQALATFGRLDVLVNNASRFHPTPLGTASDQDWDAMMNGNLRAPFLLSQRLAPALCVSGKGAIVNIVDIYAEKPLAEHSLYCMSKAALAMMTRSLARELGPTVRVNGVAPGAILWPEHGPAQQPEQRTAQQQAIIEATALKRAGEPGNIADAVVWLALHAPYVTGQILAVDGGRSLALPGA